MALRGWRRRMWRLAADRARRWADTATALERGERVWTALAGHLPPALVRLADRLRAARRP